MTILVGMVGSDGIVLAADGRMVRPAALYGDYDDTSSILKITNLGKHGVAYAAAGDYISWRAGQVLSEVLDNEQFDFVNVSRSLQNVGKKAFEHEWAAIETVYADNEEGRQTLLAYAKDSTPRGLLIVFYGKQVQGRQLWGLSLHPTTSFAHPLNKAIYGAIGNLARFFGEYFVEQMPITKLQFLAAHTAHGSSL